MSPSEALPARDPEPDALPGRSWRLAMGVTLGLFLLGFMLPRWGPDPEFDAPSAPEFDLGSLRLGPEPEPRGPGVSAEPELELERGGEAWLQLELARPGSLCVFELPGFGRSGSPARALLEAELGAGPHSLSLAVPAQGDSLCLLLLLSAVPLGPLRSAELAAGIRQSGPWLRPVLLRELRGEGSAEPLARAYGLSAPLRPRD